jgi:hypothetical protein
MKNFSGETWQKVTTWGTNIISSNNMKEGGLGDVSGIELFKICDEPSDSNSRKLIVSVFILWF